MLEVLHTSDMYVRFGFGLKYGGKNCSLVVLTRNKWLCYMEICLEQKPDQVFRDRLQQTADAEPAYT